MSGWEFGGVIFWGRDLSKGKMRGILNVTRLCGCLVAV